VLSYSAKWDFVFLWLGEAAQASLHIRTNTGKKYFNMASLDVLLSEAK
jgi:hypothetical protein